MVQAVLLWIIFCLLLMIVALPILAWAFDWRVRDRTLVWLFTAPFAVLDALAAIAVILMVIGWVLGWWKT